jgi:hypothetical protein
MKCPHCLISFHPELSQANLLSGNEGYWVILYQQCPACNKFVAFLQVSPHRFGGTATWSALAYPKGMNRSPLSAEVEDQNVINDYNEATLIIADSPKASAALSRRCLQYILREKAQIKKGDLNDEIQQVLDSAKLSSDIAENLDAVRNIGNFAAHPIKGKSTGEIVEVGSNEAEWNLEVLEQLIDFYYVRPAIAKKKREELNSKLAEAGKPPLK